MEAAQNKHTPGPWFAVQNSSYWQINTKDGWQIGDTCASSCSPEYGCSMALGKANAHLMAAAPELLEICKELLTHASMTEHMSASAVERARVAIAKAEGRTH